MNQEADELKRLGGEAIRYTSEKDGDSEPGLVRTDQTLLVIKALFYTNLAFRSRLRARYLISRLQARLKFLNPRTVILDLFLYRVLLPYGFRSPLSHPPLAREGWVISKYEGNLQAKSHWDSNQFGNFVRISAGNDREVSNICIPTGRHSEGIKLFVKALNVALSLQEGQESRDKVLNFVKSPAPLDLPELMLPVERVDEEQTRFPSISSNIFELDIAQVLRVDSITEKGQNTDSKEELEKEEKRVQKLFQPAFEAYFETIFKVVERQIKEALARTELLDKLKMGLFQNMSGKTLRATRETVKSMEKVTLVQFEDSKYPAFVSCSKADEGLMAEFLTREQAVESQSTFG
ncbi:unnamed protein product [Cuscuta campestris]|uniref:Uncharacterized protein n=1 Tax=Cuscuta campestris TaxID=132261 RepID=A0A484NG87_9ASTE|nr:unnamed protein product [Cuscuta campestris]